MACMSYRPFQRSFVTLHDCTSGYKWFYVVKSGVMWFYVVKLFYVVKWFYVAKWLYVAKWF